jgi:hypothetical protein
MHGMKIRVDASPKGEYLLPHKRNPEVLAHLRIPEP